MDCPRCRAPGMCICDDGQAAELDRHRRATIAALGLPAAEAEDLRRRGDRMLALASRISDQASAEQRAEHERFVAALRAIWAGEQ